MTASYRAAGITMPAGCACAPGPRIRASNSAVGQFAARPVIFPDTAFAARYDRQARENLARELASLS